MQIYWPSPNFGDYQFSLVTFTGSGEKAVVFRGSQPALSEGQIAQLSQHGFHMIPGARTVYGRNGRWWDLEEIRAAFPDADITKQDYRACTFEVTGGNPIPATSVPGLEHDEEMTFEEINALQSRYLPGSGGVSTALIPNELAKPTWRAITRLREKRGDLTEFVANELGCSIEHCRTVLAPEQIDAVALAADKALSNSGFLVGDETGLGKGRIVAALVVIGIRRFGKSIFLTEGPHLFSDIWRDIRDIGMEDAVGKPFIVNNGVKILDLAASGTVLHKSLTPTPHKRELEAGTVPEGTRLILGTYSQFNRKGSLKQKWLGKIAPGALLVRDETHNAIADSAISAFMLEVEKTAGACAYSSATFVRDASSLAYYAKLIPAGLASEQIPDILRKGGSSLKASLTLALAESGSLIRREHDHSNLKINIIEDTKNSARNREYADYLSEVLWRMAEISRQVNQLCRERNEDLEEAAGRKIRPVWVAGNFGGRLSLIAQQFLTSIMVDHCAEACLEAALAGEKTVVAIDRTMESLLSEFTDGNEADVIPEEASFLRHNISPEEAPRFADCLLVILKRIMTVKYRPRGADPMPEILIEDGVLQLAAEVAVLIDGFPDIPVSPIDALREAITELAKPHVDAGALPKGFIKTEEISGRKEIFVNGTRQTRKNTDRNEQVIGFNSGDIDNLVITQSASAGLSLHAAPWLQDQRRRAYFELEIPAGVLDRIQRWGRVNRRGQVSDPRFGTLCTDLPFHKRILAAQNRKIQEFSVFVSASDEAATLMDVPDLLNEVGNDVCKRLLWARPALAERLGIPLLLEDEEPLYYVSKFLFRLCLLPTQQQDTIFSRICEAYEDALLDLKAQGHERTLRRTLSGEWIIEETELFDKVRGTDDPFGRPIYLSRATCVRDNRPLPAANILEQINASRNELEATHGCSTREVMNAYIAQIQSWKDAILQNALPGRFKSVASALQAPGTNPVKVEQDRITKLIESLSVLEPGCSIVALNSDGAPSNGVVLSVKLPEMERAHYTGRYLIEFAFPGDEKVRQISLSGLFRQGTHAKLYGLRKGQVPTVLPAFESPDLARRQEERWFLSGNVFWATYLAAKFSLGTPYQINLDGHEVTGIAVRADKLASIRMTPVCCRSAEDLTMMFLDGSITETFTEYPDQGAGIRIFKFGEAYALRYPNDFQGGSKVQSALSFLNVQKRFGAKEARFDADALPDVMSALVDECQMQFFVEGRMRGKFYGAGMSEVVKEAVHSPMPSPMPMGMK